LDALRAHAMSAPEPLVTLGRISGVYGVRGWVKLHSYTDPPVNLLGFDSWILRGPALAAVANVEASRSHGKGLVAKLCGIDDRDGALRLIGAEIAVPRAALPPCNEGEYYWVDLEGLAVETTKAYGSTPLGRVKRLIATGAHDVLVVAGERERLIPFVPEQTVHQVDLDRGVITVDWDPDY
jgi:16S rRNA processing protein RimM